MPTKIWWEHNGRWFFWGYVGLMLFLTLKPITSGDKAWAQGLLNAFPWVSENVDKIVHVALFLIFSLGLKICYSKIKLMLVFLLSLVFGVIIEALQACMHMGRSAEIMDVVFNQIGCISGIFIYYFGLFKK